jgi:hypothetical protein
VIADLGEGVEAVLGEDDLVAGLAQKELGAATNGVAVVDDQHLDRACRHAAHGELPLLLRVSNLVSARELTPLVRTSLPVTPAGAPAFKKAFEL